MEFQLRCGLATQGGYCSTFHGTSVQVFLSSVLRTGHEVAITRTPTGITEHRLPVLGRPAQLIDQNHAPPNPECSNGRTPVREYPQPHEPKRLGT